MIHARTDYNRIQDPALQDNSLLSDGSSPIGEDEPVFLVRAKDKSFNATVLAWMDAHLDAGGDPAMYTAMAAHLGRAIAWQGKHSTKVADAPHDVLKSS